MDKCSGTDRSQVREQLVEAALDLSRAHLLMTGVVDWSPPPVRPHAEEVLEVLEQAMLKLRSASVHLDIDVADP